MKRFGILVSIFVILGSLGAMWVSSKLVLARNNWSKRVLDARTKAEKSRLELARLEKEVDLKKSDLQRARFDWESVWPVVAVDRGRMAGVLTVALGTQPVPAQPGMERQPGLKQNDVIYLFQPSADGAGTEYVGPFKVTAIQETSCAVVPFWRFRQGDDVTWRPGPNWRVRANIPNQHKTTLTIFETQFLQKDEAIVAQQEHLLIQQENKAGADRHLQLRMKELNGDPELEPKKNVLDKFVVEGLQKAVADEEVIRDAVQADVDQLRRAVKQARDKIEQLKTDNEKLASELATQPQVATKASE